MMKSPEKFKDFLMEFKANIDNNKVPKQNIKPASKIIKENPDAFVFDKIVSKSSAAAGVSSWVKNIVLYWDVIQIIVPKRKLVADSE